MIISAIIFLVSVSVCVVFFWMVSKQKTVYIERTQERAEKQAYRDSLQSLMRTLEDTKEERAALVSRVIKDDEVITFLSLIETLGKEQGIALTTNSLTVLPVNDTFETLVIALTLEGTYSEMTSIIKLLEQLPYQSSVAKVTMSKEKGSGLWKGSLEVSVTKLKKI